MIESIVKTNFSLFTHVKKIVRKEFQISATFHWQCAFSVSPVIQIFPFVKNICNYSTLTRQIQLMNTSIDDLSLYRNISLLVPTTTNIHRHYDRHELTTKSLTITDVHSWRLSFGTKCVILIVLELSVLHHLKVKANLTCEWGRQ